MNDLLLNFSSKRGKAVMIFSAQYALQS